jgi:multidrug resistance efflux pump
VLVREGDAVAKGTVLVRIDPRDAASRRRQQELAVELLKAEIEKARETLALTETQVSGATRVAEADLARSDADADLARRNAQRERGLLAGKATTPQAIDDAETRVRMAETAVARARDSLQLAKDRAGEVRVAKRTLEVLEARLPIEVEKLHELDLLLEKHEVCADAPGTVVGKLVNAGELAQPGKALVSLIDEEDKYVRVYIPVPDLVAIRVGTEMEVELDFLPGSRIPGKVEWVDSQAAFTTQKFGGQDDRVTQVYQARVRLTPGAAREIKAGAEASVRVKRAA